MKINNLYKKALFLAVICLFIGAGVMPSISSDEPVSKGTIYVDDDADPSWYDATHVKTIQEGIDNASAGDTVFVYNGTYYENVIVNKTIDLIGEDRNTTIIDGGGNHKTPFPHISKPFQSYLNQNHFPVVGQNKSISPLQ